MKEMSFGPGEEKLAEAWKQIDVLWRAVFMLRARVEVGSYVLASLIKSTSGLETLRETWRRISSESLPAEILGSHHGQSMPEVAAAANHQVAFWNEVIEAAVAADRQADPE